LNWLTRTLGYRPREYRGGDLSVRVDPGLREIVSIVLTRDGASRKLGGERIGKRWEGIGVHLPSEVDLADVPQIVRDLEIGLGALRYGYVISRTVGVDPVSETEQQAAIAELNELGFDVERSADPRQTTLKPRPGVPRRDAGTAKRRTQRIMSLVLTLRGTRMRVELLAKSKEFDASFADYMPR
jgi:hypothetical protein